MIKTRTVRRYIDALKGDELRRAGHAEVTPTGATTFNPVTLDVTEWVIVPFDDPRIDTIEEPFDA